MSNRNETAHWRSQIAGFVEGTDSNLRNIRKDAATLLSSNPPALPLGSRAPARHPEAVATARAELSTLLAAVQGSLADLRVEVAAAKRLSTNASAVVAGDMSPVAKGPTNRSSSVQPRTRDQRAISEITPPMHLRTSTTAVPYGLGQPFGPLFTSPPGPDSFVVSPQALLAGSISTPPASIVSSTAPQNEELVKAIDQRLLELGHKIERSLERSMEEQSLRSQLQHAVQAAAVVQQQQQMLMRSSAPSQLFTGFGNLAAAAAAAATGAPSIAEGPVAPTTAATVASGPASTGSSGVIGTSTTGPSPLVLLAMNKADAAEKLSTEVSKELHVLQKATAKESEDMEKRMSGLQDASRQHWEKMCQVSSQVESLLSHRTGAAELQAEVARVATKLVQLEANQDRSMASIDEHQRLMRQLTTAFQKLTQEADSEHTISIGRHSELAAKLEASAARTGELEARMARVGDVEVRMARLADVELKLARLGELEARMARVTDVEARTARLPDVEARLTRLADLEVKVARMGDVEAKLSRLGDVETRLARLAEVEARVGRLGDVEARLARLADTEIKLARLGEIEARLARVGDVEAKMSRLTEMEAKLARLTDMELQVARMGDVDAKMMRLNEVETKLARIGDADVRSKQLGDLEARVSVLQASVATVTAVAANTTASRSAPPAVSPALAPDVSTQEALRRLAALEQQVARLAAAEQSSQVQERERRRGAVPLGSQEGFPAPPSGLYSEVSGPPGHGVRTSSGTGTRHDGQYSSGPAKDILERVKVLEETVMHGSFGHGMSSRSVQAILARTERLEQIVRVENSIEAMAQEARLAVAEEFVLELRRDFQEVVGPTLEKLAAHVSELRKGQMQGQGSPDAGKVVTELRILTERVDALDAQLAEVADLEQSIPLAYSRGAPGGTRDPSARSHAISGFVGAMQERISMLELQVKELSGAVEDHNSIFSRLQRHQAHLDRIQHELETLRSGLGKEVVELNSRVTAADSTVDDVRGQLETLMKLDEQLAGISDAVRSLDKRLGGQERQITTLVQSVQEQRQTAEATRDLSGQLRDKVVALEEWQTDAQEQWAASEEAVGELTGRLEDQAAKVERLEHQLGQRAKTEAAVQELEARVQGQEGKLAALEVKQSEQQVATEAAMKSVTKHLGGQEEVVAELRKQHQEHQTAADSAVQGLSKRLDGQGAKLAELGGMQRDQHKTTTVALLELTERLEGQEGKVAELALQQDEQRKALEAASTAAAAVAVTAAGAAAAAGAGAGAVSRALPPETRAVTPDPEAQDVISKEVLEEVGNELRTKLEGLRGSLGDVRKELSSKVQVLDAQIRELLAFREEILSSYVELQDGVERASNTADDALRKAEANGEKLQALSEQVESYGTTGVDEMDVKVSELQQRVSDNAATQQGRLESLEAKVHALNELLTAASHDSQAAVEARSRAEELAYELSQAQESLESLALDSGRLAEQLANVASSGDKTAERLDRIATDVEGHSTAIAHLQDGLRRVESQTTIAPQSMTARSPAPLPPRPVPDSSVEGMMRVGRTASGEASDTGSRLSMTLPASRLGPSQAILNPLYSASSEDNVFGIIMPSTSVGNVQPSDFHGSNLSPEKSGAPAPQQQLLTPGESARPRPLLEPLSSGISGETVRDKAQFYEQLATKTAIDNAGVISRRNRSGSQGATEAASSQEMMAAGSTPLRTCESGGAGAAGVGGPFATLGLMSSLTCDSELMSPGAAATGAVGLAGLRQAAQASSNSRSLPQTPTGPTLQPASPLAATGALAAVRAARSGGLSGDLSSPPVEESKEEARASPLSGAGASCVFGREQTFRRGFADEEVAVSSSGDEGERERKGASGILNRERTFRRGEADEEVSISSDTEDVVESGNGAGEDALEAPAPYTHLTTTQGFDDEDDALDLGGLAPPPASAAAPANTEASTRLASAEPNAPKPEGDTAIGREDARSSKSSSSSSSSESGDIDEDILDEFGVNQPAFDDDEDISSAWPGPAAPVPSAPQSNPAAVEGIQSADSTSNTHAAFSAAAPSSAAPTSAKTTAPAPAPASAAAVAEDHASQLSTSGGLGGQQLAPLQLSSSAAAMFSLSGDNLSRRKLPPLGALAPLGPAGGGGGNPLAGNPALSSSRGFDLLRPPLGSLQNSGNLSGDLQTSLGEFPPARILAPLPPLQRPSTLPPVGISSTGVCASSGTVADSTNPRETIKQDAHPAAEALPEHMLLPAHSVEPGSPLCSLLSRPVQQPHPSESVDHDAPMPAIPESYTDTSGSVPSVGNGDLSGLSQEPSTASPFMPAPFAQATTSSFPAGMPIMSEPSDSEGASVPAVIAGPSGRNLAALLDSDSDSFHRDNLMNTADIDAGAPLSGSGFAIAAATSNEPAGLSTEGETLAPPPFPPLSPVGDRGKALPPLGRLGALPPLGRLGALPPLSSPPPGSSPLGLTPLPATPRELTAAALSSVSLSGSHISHSAPIGPAASATTTAQRTDVANTDGNNDEAEEVPEDYDDDFDDGANSSAPQGVSPSVTNAPSAASIKVPPPLDNDDSNDPNVDLELPGMSAGHNALSASDSLTSLATPLPGISTRGGGSSAAPMSALPPLPPGARRTIDPVPVPPSASTASRVSLLTSEDSLALIAPPDGVGGGLLEEGSDDGSIFARSADTELIGAALGGTGTTEPGRRSTQLSLGSTQPQHHGHHRESSSGQRKASEAGALTIEPSNTSLDFNGELSVEAERVVAMLSSAQPSAGGAISLGGVTSVGGATSVGGTTSVGGVTSVGGTTTSYGGGTSIGGAASEAGTFVHKRQFADSDEFLNAPPAIPLTGLRSIYAPRPGSTETTGGGAGLSNAGGNTGGVRSIYASTAAAAVAVQADSRVQGSLDFYDEEEEVSSSDGDGEVGRQGGMAAAYGGAAGSLGYGLTSGGISGLSRTYSNDSMELEVFKPPTLAAQPQQQPSPVTGSSRERRDSSESNASASSLRMQQQEQERLAVPAIPFANSLGDLSTSSGAYRVQVATGTRPGAGCSKGSVRLTLYGSEGTHVAQLRPAARKHDGRNAYEDEFFQEGSTSDFMIDTSGDLGDLSTIYIWHEGEGFSASWYVETVMVEQLMTGLEWTFEVHDWVRGGQRGGRVVRMPGANLSLSRENSLARLAGTGLSGSQPTSPGPGSTATANPGPSGRPGTVGSGGVPQRRGLAAMGDESMDVSSDMPSPMDMGGPSDVKSGHASSNESLSRGAQARRQGLETAASASAARIGIEQSGGNLTTTSGSVNFSDGDNGDDLLPGIGTERGSGAAAAAAGGSSTPKSVFAGASVVAAAAIGVAARPRMASNVPQGIGVVLEEDIEEVDGMLSTSAAFSLGPVSSRSGPTLVSPRPPLPPGAPRRRDSLADDLEESSADLGGGGSSAARRLPLPPTPPMNRRNSGGHNSSSGRRLSLSALETESSLESLTGVGVGAGVGAGLNSRRRVRISCSGDDGGDLTSELSVEGSELSIASVASLSLYAPEGVRPPPLAGSAIGVDYMGTSRKRVSWAEYAEEFEFLRDDANSNGSVATLTEEDLLAAQGETVRPSASSVGYDELIRGSNTVGSGTAAAEPSNSAAAWATLESAPGDGADGTSFTDVPLKQRRGKHANSYGYKIKIFTADKLNAGLGNSTVHLELLGREATVAQTLPKDRGTFQRGCVDRFTLYSTVGDMGQLLALKIWHEGKTIGPGNWGFEQVVIDDKLKGNRYVFRNPDPEGVLRKGRRNCLVLKPSVSRIDETEDLAEVAREYETQLAANRDLSELERAGLRGKLDKINQRLSKLGTKLARSLSGSLGFP